MEVIYNIPVQTLHKTHKYLAKLQKRAKKGGQEVFTFKFDDEVKTHKFHDHNAENVEGQGDIIHSYKYRVLRVNQDITVHEGWIPIAKLDVIERKMKSYEIYNKEVESLGDSMWTKHCDHCGHNKIVHTAFIMQNGDKFMKVGKGCMKELAPAMAAQIAREFDIYALWSDYLALMTAPEGGADGSFNGRGGFGGGMSVDYIYDKTTLILAMRAALECTEGKWITSKYSEYESGNRWGGNSQEIINKGSRTFDYIQWLLSKQLSFIPDQKYVDSVNADINTCLEKYPDQFGERLEEAKSFAAAEKARAIDIFIVKTAQTIIQREAAKDQMRVSEFQGAVGTKLSLTLEIVSVKHGVGMYGGWTLTIFKDQNGNMFKKFGSVADRFKNNDVYQFTAPVKAFETYQEIKYTVLGGPLSKFNAKAK
jgi:transcription elongation factor Elf1